MFVECGHDRNYLNYQVNTSEPQAPKTENTDSNIIKLPWIPIVGPRIKKELRKTKYKVIYDGRGKYIRETNETCAHSICENQEDSVISKKGRFRYN